MKFYFYFIFILFYFYTFFYINIYTDERSGRQHNFLGRDVLPPYKVVQED